MNYIPFYLAVSQSIGPQEANQLQNILIYSKNIFDFSINLLSRTEKQNDRYTNPDNDPRGVWTSTDLLRMEHRDNSVYEITAPNGKVWKPEPGTSWRHPENEVLDMIENNEIYWGVDGNAKPRRKRFLSEVKQGIVPQTIWKHEEVGHTQEAKQHLIKLFGGDRTFDTPKPVRLIKRMLNISTSSNTNDIILDFFAGSNTIAQAVFEQNEEDGGNRRFICIQLPEITDVDSDAYKAGFKTISDIGQKRIIKSIQKLESDRNGKMKFETAQNLGFRKYTLAPSNFKIWRGDLIENEAELTKQMELFVTPQRANAQSDNILWELLIKNGVPLTEKIQQIEVGEGAIIYHTSDKRFAFVLDKYTPDVQEKVLALKPRTVICLDSLFQNEDMVKTNAQLKLEDNGITFKTV
jgi:adenine-specific DNA-methyltransferase